VEKQKLQNSRTNSQHRPDSVSFMFSLLWNWAGAESSTSTSSITPVRVFGYWPDVLKEVVAQSGFGTSGLSLV
jgi:hypothetical protein